ncbi:MAG: aminoacetone oxidase family FAD-binding enzyme, partial [Candidatus Omnitrophica bacterium]|nr:aminoacetone oxidase family FAD-binding enzyme [Candidatus Omnitrophota bacterium]
MKEFDAIIIGAGPAGMMAAIRAAERNRNILLVEQNDILGRKLLISGKGRCNLTNSCDIEGFLEKFSPSRAFLRNAFAKFFNTDLMSFFEDAHLKLKIERAGRVFPESNRSGDVLNVLKSKLKNRNIKVLLDERVREIIINNKKIEGILTYSRKQILATHIAITTGGLTYPGTGSTGDGYRMAERLGHEIIPLKPALVPVIIKEKFIKDWQGIALKNARLTLFAGGESLDERFGEILFTHFGLSGPVILDISASVYDALKRKNDVAISINFKPALDHKKLNARLLREFKANPRKGIKNIFKNLLP